MKKYLAMFAVLFTVFLSSCSNDDIPVLNPTVIRVNPATVMSKFTYQINAGDLDGVDSDEQLRIRLYIFDENGNLYSKQEQTVRNYLTTASFDVNLGDEYYTAVAVTDVTDSEVGHVSEYWEVTGEENLSSIRVTYLGWDGTYGDQEILGISSTTIYSGFNTTIDVEAAGALVCTRSVNIHAYSNVQGILVWGNRGNGFYDFSTSGRIVSNPDLEALPLFANIDVNDYGYAVYSYKFLMPQTNYTLKLGFSDSNGDPIHMAERTGITIQKGHEYLYEIVLDPNDDASGDYSTSFTDVTGKYYSRSNGDSEMNDSHPEQQSCSSTEAPCKSWKVKDLL